MEKSQKQNSMDTSVPEALRLTTEQKARAEAVIDAINRASLEE